MVNIIYYVVKKQYHIIFIEAGRKVYNYEIKFISLNR